ncbi:MAG: hypothetical protein WA776_20290 [Xanthobacteraceae bacterium]
MKTIAAACSIALVLAFVQPASAIVPIGQPAAAPPPATLGVAGGLAVGVIGTAALLCIYDVWLKVNGYKNWDGSQRLAQLPAHHHHH